MSAAGMGRARERDGAGALGDAGARGDAGALGDAVAIGGTGGLRPWPATPVTREPSAMTPSREQGPFARSGAERALLVLETLLAIAAFGGAAGFLLAWPGFTDLAASLPFDGSLVVAGVALALVVGVLPTLVVIGTLRRRRWARPGHVVVGVALILWVVVQVVVLGPPISPLQVVYLVYGIAIAWLGEQRLREAD